jgi:broad specificity polyphosphatase/5'/3'-nucleotidase SurE
MVSVTPLHLDLTNYSAFQRLQPWSGMSMPGEPL